MTRVVLQPPTDSSQALRHQEQLMRDATEQIAEQNYGRLNRLAASRRIVVPATDSDVYRQRVLVSWAAQGGLFRARFLGRGNCSS